MAEVVAAIHANPDLFPEFRAIDLDARLTHLKIIVSEDPQYVEILGVEQMSVAKNFNGPDRVIVYRAGWKGIKDRRKIRALVLHEVCGLVGLESSGDYRISQRMAKDLTPAEALALNDKYIWEITSDPSFRDLLHSTLIQDFASLLSLSSKSAILDGRFLVTEGCMEHNCTYNRAAIVTDIRDPKAMLIVRKQRLAGNARMPDGPDHPVVIQNRPWYQSEAYGGSYTFSYEDLVAHLRRRGFAGLADELSRF